MTVERMETEGDKVEILKRIFPNLDEEIVIDALASNEWNVEVGVQSLLIISENQICAATMTDIHFPTLPLVTPLQEVNRVEAKPPPSPQPPLPRRQRGKGTRRPEGGVSTVTQGPSFQNGDRFIKEHPRALILMRGVPGSGKSTLAKELAGRHNGVCYSTDDYHYDENGVYNFDPANLSEYHAKNQRRSNFAMEAGISPVIIDNTNLELWEMRPYAMSAIQHGYEVAVLEPDTPWRYDPRICGQKNTHGVPKNKIAQMIEKLRRNAITANQVKAYGMSCLANSKPNSNDIKSIDKGKDPRKRHDKPGWKEHKEHEKTPPGPPVGVENPSEQAEIHPSTSFEKMLPPSTEQMPTPSIEEMPAPTRKCVPEISEVPVAEPIDFDVILEHGERGRSDTSTSGQTSDHDGPSEDKPKKLRRKCKIAARFSNPTTGTEPPPTLIAEPPKYEETPTLLSEFGSDGVEITPSVSATSFDSEEATSVPQGDVGGSKAETVCSEGSSPGKEPGSSLSPSIFEVENLPRDWDVLGFKPEPSSVPKGMTSAEPLVICIDKDVQTNFGDNSSQRIISTRPRPISAGVTSPPPIRNKLTLDKGTSIEEGDFESNASVRLLVRLFPSAGVESLKDVLENCRGNVDWAVNVLLDSGYDMSSEVEEVEEVEEEVVAVQEMQRLVEVRASDVEPREEDVAVEVAQESGALSTPHHGAKLGTREESEKLKNLVEELFVMSPSVSEHARRITGKTDYSGFKAYEIRCKKGLEVPRSLEAPADSQTPSDKESVPSGSAEEEVRESASPLEDGEMVPMTLTKDFAVRLRNMFGSAADDSLKGIHDLKPDDLNLVIPKSLAFELFSYWCSSLFCAQETKQDDEKAAAAVSNNLNSRRETNLQEIMDMELALQITEDEKNNSEEMKNMRKTMAFKLTQNKLHESFPQVDTAYLDAVFEAHLYNYENTVKVLKELTGRSAKEIEPPAQNDTTQRYDEVEETLSSPVSDWRDARASAQQHIARRQSYLALADAAHRKGMPAVSSYYTRQARFHAESAKDYDAIATELLAQKSRVQNEDGYTVDLHFLYVPEALKVLDGHIRQLRDRGEVRAKGGFLQVITGRGLRSINGVSRIKPAVEAYLRQKKIKFEELNPGMLKVYLR